MILLEQSQKAILNLTQPKVFLTSPSDDDSPFYKSMDENDEMTEEVEILGELKLPDYGELASLAEELEKEREQNGVIDSLA
jgi:hypothetical protein